MDTYFGAEISFTCFGYVIRHAATASVFFGRNSSTRYRKLAETENAQVGIQLL